MSTPALLTLCIALFAASIFSPAPAGAGERKKSLDFEEQTVEGMNKRPLDSLNSMADGLKNSDDKHLYRKKRVFHVETQRNLKDLEALSWKR
jgi:hypothetical protein